MQRFGEKLRALRKQHGMTLEELALALDLTTHSHLSNIESGRKKTFPGIGNQDSRLFQGNG
jgi:transcriptional regulator with XRE-family HTH domain